MRGQWLEYLWRTMAQNLSLEETHAHQWDVSLYVPLTYNDTSNNPLVDIEDDDELYTKGRHRRYRLLVNLEQNCLKLTYANSVIKSYLQRMHTRLSNYQNTHKTIEL